MVTTNWLNLMLEKATIVHVVNFSFGIFFSRCLVFLEGKQKYLYLLELQLSQNGIVGLNKRATECFVKDFKGRANYAGALNIANHAWRNNHSIDFDGATAIDKGNHHVQRTLESWHTAKTVGTDKIPNHCQDDILFNCNFISFACSFYSFSHLYCILSF